VVAISSFGIAELVWTLLARRFRWGVWAACLLATCPFFISLPSLLNFRAIFGKNFWARPAWSTAISTYESSLGIAFIWAFVLILCLGLLLGDSLLRRMRELREGIREGEFGLPEIILVSSFLLYPALLVVLTKLLDSGYAPRYGWPAILGLVLGSVYLVQ